MSFSILKWAWGKATYLGQSESESGLKGFFFLKWRHIAESGNEMRQEILLSAMNIKKNVELTGLTKV